MGSEGGLEKSLLPPVSCGFPLFTCSYLLLTPVISKLAAFAFLERLYVRFTLVMEIIKGMMESQSHILGIAVTVW